MVSWFSSVFSGSLPGLFRWPRPPTNPPSGLINLRESMYRQRNGSRWRFLKSFKSFKRSSQMTHQTTNGNYITNPNNLGKLQKPPFGVRLCKVAISWLEHTRTMNYARKNTNQSLGFQPSQRHARALSSHWMVSYHWTIRIFWSRSIPPELFLYYWRVVFD